jgi:hypothetical protein
MNVPTVPSSTHQDQWVHVRAGIARMSDAGEVDLRSMSMPLQPIGRIKLPAISHHPDFPIL